MTAQEALCELLSAHVEEMGPQLDGPVWHKIHGGSSGTEEGDLTRLDKALLRAAQICGFETLQAVWEAEKGFPYVEEK